MLELNANILWNFVNFIVLCLLLKKFLFKPVLGIIEKREQEIQSAYAAADLQNKKAAALKEQYSKSMEAAKSEADEILNGAKAKSQMEYDNMLKAAKEAAARVMSAAEETISLEKEKALLGIQSEIADIAIAAAAKVSDKGIDEAAGRKLIDGFLAEAGAVQ